jgi:hypothetical protein
MHAHERGRGAFMKRYFPNPALLATLAISIAAAMGSPSPSSLPSPSQTAKPASPFAVVELFTSQGCSSCPPADRILGEIAGQAGKDRRPVFALSFHVDYWNHLGWKDPFSRPGFTERQRLYSQAFEGRIYTPQMIVNGTWEFTGSKGGTARERIAEALSRPSEVAIALETDLAADGRSLRISYRASGHAPGNLLNLALVEKDISVPVERGENGGRTLRHENVVRAFRTLSLDADGAGNAELEIPPGTRTANAMLIAYAQRPVTMRLLGASGSALATATRPTGRKGR